MEGRQASKHSIVIIGAVYTLLIRAPSKEPNGFSGQLQMSLGFHVSLGSVPRRLFFVRPVHLLPALLVLAAALPRGAHKIAARPAPARSRPAAMHRAA
eukprot:1159276-Pelagomonas_calceolata.AAC.3